MEKNSEGYKLAKQLKDIGFTQDGMGSLYNGHSSMEGYNNDYEEIYFPTLSELIEACGKPFRQLEKYEYTENRELSYRWEALALEDSPVNSRRFVDSFIGKGLTPEEAVAKLWLELNKK